MKLYSLKIYPSPLSFTHSSICVKLCGSHVCYKAFLYTYCTFIINFPKSQALSIGWKVIVVRTIISVKLLLFIVLPVCLGKLEKNWCCIWTNEWIKFFNFDCFWCFFFFFAFYWKISTNLRFPFFFIPCWLLKIAWW